MTVYICVFIINYRSHFSLTSSLRNVLFPLGIKHKLSLLFMIMALSDICYYILQMKYILEQQVAVCSSKSLITQNSEVSFLYLFTNLFCKDFPSLIRINPSRNPNSNPKPNPYPNLNINPNPKPSLHDSVAKYLITKTTPNIILTLTLTQLPSLADRLLHFCTFALLHFCVSITT